jgi:hypothetical protein
LLRCFLRSITDGGSCGSDTPLSRSEQTHLLVRSATAVSAGRHRRCAARYCDRI